MEKATGIRHTGYSGGSISSYSSSGTVVSTAYTSNVSCESSIVSSSSGTLLALPFDCLKIAATTLEEMAREKMKEITILVQQFVHPPSTTLSSENCSVVGDVRIIDGWLRDTLGVGWVLHLHITNGDGDGDGAQQQVFDRAWSWIEALDKITEIVRFMESLTPDDDRGSMGRLSICEEEEEPQTETESSRRCNGSATTVTASIIPNLFQFAQFIQQAMSKLLIYVDVIIAAPNVETHIKQQEEEVAFMMNRGVPQRYLKLKTLLSVHAALSEALSAIRWLLRSPSSAGVERIQGEVVNLLSEKERNMCDAIWSTMEQIRTRLLDLTEKITPRSSDIHKATKCVMWYISFLWFNDEDFQPRRSSRYSHYSLLNAAVDQAATLGLYVPRITQAPPLMSLFIEMASCVEEKLASKSESSFQDKALRFLFLLNNSYSILELKENLRGHALEAFLSVFARKVDGYMDSYLQISWAPMVSCLFNPAAHHRFWRKHSQSQLPRFESEFQKVYATQKEWKVPDPELKKTLRKAITEKVIPHYTKYINKNKVTTPKFIPRELEKMLQELFEG